MRLSRINVLDLFCFLVIACAVIGFFFMAAGCTGLHVHYHAAGGTRSAVYPADESGVEITPSGSSVEFILND